VYIKLILSAAKTDAPGRSKIDASTKPGVSEREKELFAFMTSSSVKRESSEIAKTTEPFLQQRTDKNQQELSPFPSASETICLLPDAYCLP
jgi:hypothetical protein